MAGIAAEALEGPGFSEETCAHSIYYGLSCLLIWGV